MKPRLQMGFQHGGYRPKKPQDRQGAPVEAAPLTEEEKHE